MKHIIFLFMISTVLGCNSKRDNDNSAVLNQYSEKNMSGKEIVSGLEDLDFFNLTEPSELEEVKVAFEKSYMDLNFFQGKLRGESLEFMDNRYFWVDCEELFEIGGLTKYLGQVKRTFIKLGLKLEFSNEKSEQDQNKWKHTIELNGNEYVAFDEQFSDIDWAIAYVNFIEMLNLELKKQGSKEQFYPISCGNDGAFVLLTPQQFDFVSSNYPKDDEHPSTLVSWKNRIIK